MSHENSFVKKVQLMDLLKSPKETTLCQCMENLCVSRRSFFRYIEEFRDAGAVIVYSKRNDSYSLINEFDYMEYVLSKSR